MNTTQAAETQYLDRPEGRLAYDVAGHGPLVVCLPGMGDIRSTYRYQLPVLVAAGYRVATVDLRGHGDSDATFSSYDDEATASDLVALIEKLGGPAVVLGNSLGAGASVVAAASRPELFAGLALIGPFVRNPQVSGFQLTLFRVLMAQAWARPVWKGYLPKLYAGRKPADFDAHLAAMIDAMRAPGKTRAFSRTSHTSHAPAEAAAPQVTAPTLVVMGCLDPDFPDAEAEAQWIADTTGGAVVMVDDAGHYPHAQRPDVVNPALLDFIGRLDLHA